MGRPGTFGISLLEVEVHYLENGMESAISQTPRFKELPIARTSGRTVNQAGFVSNLQVFILEPLHTMISSHTMISTPHYAHPHDQQPYYDQQPYKTGQEGSPGSLQDASWADGTFS